MMTGLIDEQVLMPPTEIAAEAILIWTTRAGNALSRSG
jgi:hypothetical protein